MNDNTVYSIRQDLVHEVIDGELLAVDLKTGTYYSLDGVGAAVWSHLCEGVGTADILRTIVNKYSGSQEEIAEGLTTLLEELGRAGLIAIDDSGQPKPAVVGAVRGANQPFVAPKLVAYTDMQELLLYDPIHEVDESGWPNVAAHVQGDGAQL